MKTKPFTGKYHSLARVLDETLGYFTRPLSIFSGYRRSNVRPDLVAGLTVTLIILPQAIAYALIADLPPQTGLYAAIIGSLFGALWGSSAQMQTGPTNTVSLLTLAALAGVVSPGTPEYLAAASFLALMVGIISLAMGLARLGILVRFVSDSVIVGFTAGAGVLIFVNQIRNLLWLKIPSTSELIETLEHLIPHVGETHIPSLLVGAGTVAVILVFKKVNRRLPGPLLAMTAASAGVALLGLNVKVVSELPRSLPPFSSSAGVSVELFGKMTSGIFSIASIGLVEAISIARTMASQTGSRLISNQEFIGQGLANIFSGLFSGYPVSGSFSRSAVNLQAGAQTGVSSVFVAVFVSITLLVLGPLAAYIPMASLAGVLMLTGLGLVNWRGIKRIWRAGGSDRVILFATLAATLLLPLHFAVLTGILLSLIYYLVCTSTPQVRTVLPDARFSHFEPQGNRPACPQLGVIEILGDLYFGAVEHIELRIHEILQQQPGLRFLLLRLQSVENCDFSGINVLESVLRQCRERGGNVYLVRTQWPVREIMADSGFEQILGTGNFLDEDIAISHLFNHVLDPAVCIYECPVRAFKECQNLPKQTGELDAGCRSGIPRHELPVVQAETLWQALRQETPLRVFDVREPREFNLGHVPGAQQLSLPDLFKNPAQVPQDVPVVLVCRSGRRSARAADFLISRGYANIRLLQGGMIAWESINLLEAME